MKPFLPNDNLNTGGGEPMPHSIVAAFPGREEAEKAADDLRNMGVANERIAFLPADATVVSVANDPITYRATDMADSKQKEQDAAPAIFGSDPEQRSPATIHNPEQDLGLADEMRPVSSDLGVIISVVPQAGDADAIRQTLEAAGGVLRARAADRRITDQGAEDPESNTRVA